MVDKDRKVRPVNPDEVAAQAQAIRMEAMDDAPIQSAVPGATTRKRPAGDVDPNEIVDMDSMEMATPEDFDFSDLLEEEREYVWPDIAKIVRENFKWDVEFFPKRYLTNKKIKIRRLTMLDQEGVNKRLRKALIIMQRRGERPEQGDFDNTAYMMEKAIIPHMDALIYKKMPTVPFLYLSSCFTDAQGFHRDTFNAYRGERTNAAPA